MAFGESTPPEAMGEFTGFLVNWVAARAREAFAAMLAEHGLRPQHFATMVMIDAAPGAAQQEIVAATHIDPSTMVALLDELERAGLAERRPHATDRRKRAVHLSAAGVEELRATRAEAEALQATQFDTLDPVELAAFHRALRKLSGYAD